MNLKVYPNRCRYDWRALPPISMVNVVLPITVQKVNGVISFSDSDVTIGYGSITSAKAIIVSTQYLLDALIELLQDGDIIEEGIDDTV